MCPSRDRHLHCYKTMAITKTANAKTAKAAKAQVQAKRVSVGTAWATSNDEFYAGNLQEETAKYQNQQAMLDLVGPASEGMQWTVKLFLREVETKRGTTTVVDVVLEETEIYQR